MFAPTVKLQKFGKLNFSWQQPSAATVGNCFRQLWRRFLWWFQHQVCRRQPAATCGIREKHRETYKTRFKNTRLGQTVSCSGACVVTMILSEAKSFYLHKHFVLRVSLKGLTNNLPCSDIVLHRSSDHRTLRLTEGRHFVASLKVSGATLEYNTGWIRGHASCIQFLFLPLAKLRQRSTSPPHNYWTGRRVLLQRLKTAAYEKHEQEMVGWTDREDFLNFVCSAPAVE